MRHLSLVAGLCALLITGWLVGSLSAAIRPEHKKELKAIAAEITKVNGLITKKKYDDATNAISEIEERLTKLIEEADLKESDPQLKTVNIPLEKAKEKLAKVSGKGGASFEKSVASIFANKCVGCHGEEPKGGLRLDTFEGLEKGGANGNLIVPGNIEGSLLFQRLITPEEEFRMPKGKGALTEKEIKAIGTWIADGAKFSGDKTVEMASLAKSGASGKPIVPPSKIERETGTETVHFTKDLMPEMMDTCGRCHNDTVKRSGFSVTSFENLMKGGESGAVIVPGKPAESRLWRLVNGDDLPVMPAGNQTGITKPWYNNLKTWIQEGAKWDGADPKKKFPTLEEREAMARANYTPEEWVELRKKASAADWKKTLPKTEPTELESADFLLYGDVSKERLEQIDKWASEQASHLRQTFKLKADPLWTGKLAVFVFKDRYGFNEFLKSVEGLDAPPAVIGHSRMNATMEIACIAVQDVGDATSDTSPGMQVNVIEQVTVAHFKRGGGNLPEWIVRGAGLAMAHQKVGANPYLAAMPRLAGGILQESKFENPEYLFGSGAFSPEDVGPIGFTLVEFLIKRGSVVQFGQFVQKLQSGAKIDDAARAVYQADARTLALAYASSLPGGAPKKGKIK